MAKENLEHEDVLLLLVVCSYLFSAHPLARQRENLSICSILLLRKKIRNYHLQCDQAHEKLLFMLSSLTLLPVCYIPDTTYYMQFLFSLPLTFAKLQYLNKL